MAVNPLQSDVPIVDSEGRPTAFFMRQWENLRRAVAERAGLEGSYGGPDKGLRLTLNARGQVVDVEEVDLAP